MKTFSPAASRLKKSHFPWFAWFFLGTKRFVTYVIFGGIWPPRYVVFDGIFHSLIDRFRRNFRFPQCVVFDGISATTCILCSNISYLKQFSSASCRANKESFLYWRILGIGISYQNIFWRPTPDKKCRFWCNFGGTNMSFWVEFREIQYVVLDGILPKIKN